MVEVSTGAGLRCICLVEPGKGEEPCIFLGTDDCRIHFWKLPLSGDPYEVVSWKGHNAEVTALCHMGGRLYSCSEDGYIKVWSPKDAYLLDDLGGHDGGVVSLALGAKNILTGGRDHSVRSWDLKDMEERLQERARMTEADL